MKCPYGTGEPSTDTSFLNPICVSGAGLREERPTTALWIRPFRDESIGRKRHWVRHVTHLRQSKAVSAPLRGLATALHTGALHWRVFGVRRPREDRPTTGVPSCPSGRHKKTGRRLLAGRSELIGRCAPVPDQRNLASFWISSTQRLEYPHSLSYQLMTLKKVSLRPMPLPASKIELSGSWMKSLETTSSSV
jgi:hypothetical protein